jgi:membrane fusion protein, multidrug efflux system
MHVKSSYVFAAGLLGVVVVYFVVRSLFSTGDADAHGLATPAKDQPPSVQVLVVAETQRQYALTIRGRTEARRNVVARSETAGVVSQTPAMEGGFVRKGAVLCRLNVDARQATLDQARANLRSRQLQQQASAELAKKGFRSQTQLLQVQADLDAATASMRQAEIALEQTNIRAPFDGVFDHRSAEVGTYLSPGDPCGTVLELNPLLIVGDLPESASTQLHAGSSASAKLLSGQTLTGKVRYLGQDADPQTRTYHVEVEAQNPHSAVRSGLSATLRMAAGEGPAHLVPLTALVLDAAGRQGVRHVLADNRVAFTPVSVLDETPEGIWVQGLRGQVRVITVGQSYVAEGQQVRVAAAR